MRQKSPQFNSASGGYDLVQLPTGERTVVFTKVNISWTILVKKRRL